MKHYHWQYRGKKLSETLAALKERFHKDITPLDVVAGIVYYFGTTEFSTGYEKVNRAFYQERNDPLLQEFKFKVGPYPYSELLESVFSRMTNAGLLSRSNPDLRQYEVKQKHVDRIEAGILTKFSEEQQRELRDLSRRIRRNLSE